jgi:3',5'-cyclic AMP phosphodiesterase CpdA
MKIQWLTDPHFDHARHLLLPTIEKLNIINPDALLLGGDIGEYSNFDDFLKAIASKFKKPVFWIGGNHDIYGSSVAQFREKSSSLSSHYSNLIYLTTSDIIQLTDDTALIGHDGFADGRAGDYWRSTVQLADSEYIWDLKCLSYSDQFKVMNKFGDEAAQNIKEKLEESVQKYKHTIILTHVPPFAKGGFHRGKPQDKDWAPFFVCKAMGDAILDVSSKHKDHKITILCGHTHGKGVYNPYPWVTSINGEAHYGSIVFQKMIEV